jgi:methylenetetrahydrofolate reductase (NADPH)
VYPPRTPAGSVALYAAIDELAKAGPDFISVTYGASGSTRDRSLAVLRHLVERADVATMAHLTCVGTTTAETVDRIREIVEIGVTSFLAVRGDPPPGVGEDEAFHGELRNATDLLRLISREGSNHPNGLEVAVAAFPNGHPRSAGRDEEIETLLGKQRAGAHLALTQLLFDASDYVRFVDEARAAGVTIPIRPGIMPVLSRARLDRMLEISGERLPAGLASRLEAARDSTEAEAIGIEACVALAADLLAAGAPGIHLYAFNQSTAPLAVLDGLGVDAIA